ncbi:MAG: hypothetical protein JSW61_15390 [Candidatus Thorarchaeota archaeon]|nr:MAG: hypothetical protein JSW61_15390 [Candidatus Thorarchaeota archaeon]
MEMRRLAKVMLLISCLLLPVLGIGLDVSTFGVQERYSGLDVGTLDVQEGFSPSAVVWSDDFNDNNTDGWEIWGMNYTDPASLPANYSVSEGVLRFRGVDNHWTIAMYNTTQGVGTWSFDLDVQDQHRHHFYVPFFSGYWDYDSINWSQWLESVPYEYGIMPVIGEFSGWEDEFVLYRRSPGSGSITPLGRYSHEEMIGWHHIDIQRDSSGRIHVYLNETHVMSGQDTRFSVSECFKIYSQGGSAIDNIFAFDDFTHIDKVAPEWDQEPTNQAIDQGQAFSYNLNASDFNGIDKWAVNDTVHFEIDSNGDITNAIELSPSVYWLEVSVNDTMGNERTAVFSVTVSGSTPPPLPDLSLLAVIGGGVLAVIVVVVIIRRKS